MISIEVSLRQYKNEVEWSKGQNAPRTVTSVLAAADLGQWKGQPNDTENLCLDRVLSLRPHIRDFVTQIRVAEKFLSPAHAK